MLLEHERYYGVWAWMLEMCKMLLEHGGGCTCSNTPRTQGPRVDAPPCFRRESGNRSNEYIHIYMYVYLFPINVFSYSLLINPH